MKEKILSVVKFVAAILLLPLIIALTAAFLETLHAADIGVARAFGWGVVSYLILHILLYEPTQVFDTGKKMAEKAVGFLFPLVKIAGLCIPIFTILAFILYIPAARIWPESNIFPFFVFVAAFMFTMHMVFSANTLRGKSAGWLKENYFLSIFFIYGVAVILIALAFAFLLSTFSLSGFFERCGAVAGAIYTASFRQLFEVEGKRPG